MLLRYLDQLVATILGLTDLGGLWIKRQHIAPSAQLDLWTLTFLVLLPIGLFWWAGMTPSDARRMRGATMSMIVCGYVGIGIALTILR